MLGIVIFLKWYHDYNNFSYHFWNEMKNLYSKITSNYKMADKKCDCEKSILQMNHYDNEENHLKFYQDHNLLKKPIIPCLLYYLLYYYTLSSVNKYYWPTFKWKITSFQVESSHRKAGLNLEACILHGSKLSPGLDLSWNLPKFCFWTKSSTWNAQIFAKFSLLANIKIFP